MPLISRSVALALTVACGTPPRDRQPLSDDTTPTTGVCAGSPGAATAPGTPTAGGTSADTGCGLTTMKERCGGVDWLIHAQSSSTERLTDVAVRPDGTLALTGYFARPLTLGVGRPDAVVVPEGCVNSTWEGIVAAYRPDGTPLWQQVQQSCDHLWTQAVAVAADGSVYASGYFVTSAAFGAGTPAEVEFLGEGFFFVKYAADGTLLWAKHALLADDINAFGGVLDASVGPNDDLFVTGDYGGSVTFDPGGPQETMFEADSQPWMASYAQDGTMRWARAVGGGAGDSRGIVATSTGVAWTPEVGAEITLGVGEPSEVTLQVAAGVAAVLASYDPSDGSFQWGSLQGGNNARDAAGTGYGDVLLTGATSAASPGHFGLGQPTAVDVPAGSFYLARYSDLGALTWAVGASTGASTGRRAAAGAGLAAVTGTITTQDVLLAPCGPTFHNDGVNDYSGFAASYDLATGAFQCGWGFGGPDLDDPSAVAVGLDGAVYVVGEFQGSTTFAAGTPQEQTLVATGSDSFLVRFGPPTGP